MMCKVLIFGYIAAVILMTATYGAPFKSELSPAAELLIASMSDLKELKNIENNFLDFYTPNDKQECNQTTVACYLRELKVLFHDVEEKYQRHIINIEKNLEPFKGGNSSNPTCKKCESSKKKKFPEFHQEMNSFLQSMLRQVV